MPDYHFFNANRECRFNTHFSWGNYDLRWKVREMSSYYHLYTLNRAFYSLTINSKSIETMKGRGWEGY